MKSILIRSNPYKKEVSFYSIEEGGALTEIKNDNWDSKLREEGSDKMFLPFRIKEILDIIRKEYYVPGGDKITIVFEGTEDEYEEISSVCEDTIIQDQIHLVRSDNYLDDARDILKHTKEIFLNVYPVLDHIIGDEKAVKKDLSKVSDALDDIIPICVFGNYSSGKSTFINALIGNELLPSGGDPVTAKIYKLMASSNEDRITIEYEFRSESYELRIDKNGYRLIKGDSNNELVTDINAALDSVEKTTFFSIAGTVLSVINGFENKDKTDVVISDVISIEVPFSKSGILGLSNNRFVIFDTPGSNSNSNKDHAEILKIAMEGFSNGIPVWVSQYDSIDSVDNAKLCDDIYAIEALDKRFTMIIINKADIAELPEDGWDESDEKKFLEIDAIEKMYSGGIFFVSSVMGLGSKNEANFNSKFLRKTFKEKKESFSNPEEEEFYQTLYKYNIMPAQIKENAVLYSLGNTNLIFANSGLLCVEREMETFASKHSAYNKCQMVYSFLNSIIDKSNQRIDDSKNMLNGYKAQEQSKLDEKQAKLKSSITKESKNLNDNFDKDSKSFVKNFVKTQLTFTKDISQIESLDSKYTAENERKMGYEGVEHDLDEATEAKWSNLKNNIKKLSKGEVKFKEIIELYNKDNDTIKSNKEILDHTKKEINKETSDSLIRDVRKEYRNSVLKAKEMLDDNIKAHWLNNADLFKKKLISIITDSDALSLEERNEISSIILNYAPLIFQDSADDIFVKARFLRKSNEKLNNKRLIDSFNSRLAKEISEMANFRNEECRKSYQLWQEELLGVIDQNITEYNPELRQIAGNIAILSENIRKLEKDQQLIQTSFETIGNMMAWKSVV